MTEALRALDHDVATKVMGWCWPGGNYYTDKDDSVMARKHDGVSIGSERWSPSTSVVDCALVKAKLREKGIAYNILVRPWPDSGDPNGAPVTVIRLSWEASDYPEPGEGKHWWFSADAPERGLGATEEEAVARFAVACHAVGALE